MLNVFGAPGLVIGGSDPVKLMSDRASCLYFKVAKSSNSRLEHLNTFTHEIYME